MGELINGRTPEEIKIGILCSNGCCDCPYAGFITEDETCSEHVEKDTIALIELLEAERDAALAKVPKWISVEEQLPEHDKPVIIRIKRMPGVVYYAVATRDDGFSSGWITNDEDFNSDWGSPKVTHWMPLPEASEEEG